MEGKMFNCYAINGLRDTKSEPIAAAGASFIE